MNTDRGLQTFIVEGRERLTAMDDALLGIERTTFWRNRSIRSFAPPIPSRARPARRLRVSKGRMKGSAAPEQLIEQPPL
jgi:hypothetical protein